MKFISSYRIGLLFSALVLASATNALAAPPPPPMGPPCWPPPCIPVDNGVVFLIIAGVALGGWKIYSSYKKSVVH